MLTKHSILDSNHWYVVEISKVLQYLGHASASHNGAVSFLERPMDRDGQIESSSLWSTFRKTIRWPELSPAEPSPSVRATLPKRSPLLTEGSLCIMLSVTEESP